MGVFDSLKKGVADGIEIVTGEKKTGFTDSVNRFLGNMENAFNDLDKSAVQKTYDMSGNTPPYILADGAAVFGFKSMSLDGFSLELPEEFTPVENGGQNVLMYKGNEDDLRMYIVVKPYICIQNAVPELPREQDKVEVQNGIMRYVSKNWIPDRGAIVKYYGFTAADGTEKILLLHCRPDVMGSPFELKITSVLYHAAATLSERKVRLEKEVNGNG